MLKVAGDKFSTIGYALAYHVSRLVFWSMGQFFVISYFKFVHLSSIRTVIHLLESFTKILRKVKLKTNQNIRAVTKMIHGSSSFIIL